MTDAELIQFINDWIYTNANNEITAATLNPVLQAIRQRCEDVTGDLENLNTGTQINLVAAINEINSALSNISTGGIQLHTGIPNPNTTPPASFNNADFYMQVDESNNPVLLFQYNGFAWVSSSANPNLDDRILTMGTITRVGNTFTIPANATWRISGTIYSNPASYSVTIDEAAEGFSRVDKIVARPDNTFQTIVGVEAVGVAEAPVTPVNTVAVTTINVYEDVVGDTEPVIVGGAFITKVSKGNNYVNGGVITNLPFNGKTKFIIEKADEISGMFLSYTGLQTDSYYPNQKYTFRNISGEPIILRHLGAFGQIKFYFPNEFDYTLENNTTIEFDLNIIDLQLEFIGVIGGGVSGDYIPLSGTETGSPVTGTIEVEPANMTAMARVDGAFLVGAADHLDIDNEATRYGYFSANSNSANASAQIRGHFDGKSVSISTAASDADSFPSALISGTAGFKGLRYGHDYSADYDNRSLVDKEYCDSVAGGGGGGAWGSITGTLSDQTDLQTALDDRELLSNKSTSVTTDAASDTKYPSVKSVFDWATGVFQAMLTAANFGAFIMARDEKSGAIITDRIIIADTEDSNNAKNVRLQSIYGLFKSGYDAVYTTTAAVATQISTALSGYATLASPTFTGTPAAPTATAGTNTTQVATTAFVTAAVAAGGGGGGSSPVVLISDLVDSSAHTATLTNTLIKSFLITGGTIPDGKMLDLNIKASKTTTTGSVWNVRVYVNTSNSLSGATLLATNTVASSVTVQFSPLVRTMYVKGANILTMDAATSLTHDVGTNNTAGSLVAFNRAVNQYLIVAVELGNTGQSVIINGVTLTQF